MRDKLIHDYINVNLHIVWKTVQEEVPEVHRNVQRILRSLAEWKRNALFYPSYCAPKYLPEGREQSFEKECASRRGGSKSLLTLEGRNVIFKSAHSFKGLLPRYPKRVL